MRRAVALLCIALCVSAASARTLADSSFPSTWLSSYMSSPKASAMSGYYDEVEKATMCFRSALTCAVEHPPEELDLLTCSACPEDSHYRKQDEDKEFAIDDVSSVLGKCMLHKSMHKEEEEQHSHARKVAIIGKPGLSWAGTFYGSCYLDKSGKDICELPEGCEGTILTISGVIYKVDDAVRVGPAKASVNVCENKTSVWEPAPAKKGTASIQYAKEYYYEVEKTPKMVPVGPATVLDGTFTVLSHHAVKWEKGHFQYSHFKYTEDTKLEDTVDYPRLGDDVYKMAFQGSSKSRY